MRTLLFAAVLLSVLTAQTDVVSDAVEALQRGDLNSAESMVRSELRAHPNNPDARGVLAVLLDQQKKYTEADEVYRRAVALAPGTTALLNNYGDHLLATGKLDAARGVFLKLIALNPAHANAALQLARLALQRKEPAQALRYLDRLPVGARQPQDVEIARMQAFFELHRGREAEGILGRLSTAAGSDPGLNYSLGVALASAGEYQKSEDHLSRALEAAPDNFDVLYNRDRGKPHGSSPPTPPYMRVRIRRFRDLSR